MAAGQGFKTFTTGEVLTAADVNGYLMQGINVFASSAARAAAITSPQEGQYSFLKDTNALEYYDGASWVGAPVGDITAVTAGKGLTGGGSSGDVTVALATTAKGDLVAGSGTTTAAVLAVGANNTVLTADSSTATGLKWATPASGTFPKLTYVSPSANFTTTSTSYVDATGYTITFTPVSATNTIEVKFNAGYATSANTRSFRFMLDGVDKGGSDLLIGEINPTMILHITNLSAASHTIKLQMLSVGGGTATLAGSASGYIADFSILEIY